MAWIRELTQTTAGHLFITSRLTLVEINSAFARRLREGTVTRDEYADHLVAFDEDCSLLYHLVELSTGTLDRARDLIARHPLRTLGALQFASALLANRIFADVNLASLTFVAADDHLLQTAQREGLIVDNPNHYP